MEIVINVCYGGFGLSHKAVMEYAKMSGFKLYAYKTDYINHKSVWKPYDPKETSLFVHYLKEPYINDKQANEAYFSYRDIKRDDPILIAIVRKLGKKANGSCAKLDIVNIPDGTDWEIDEYDGNEHIAEKHQTWR